MRTSRHILKRPSGARPSPGMSNPKERLKEGLEAREVVRAVTSTGRQAGRPPCALELHQALDTRYVCHASDTK